MTAPGRVRGPSQLHRQTGVSLIVVLVLLVIVSILGVGAAQIATMGERSSRNDRDMQVAWQSAEAALQEAELEISTPASSSRGTAAFSGASSTNAYQAGCGAAGPSLGLCALNAPGTPPAWLTVDFTLVDGAAVSTPYGKFTGRLFSAGAGIQPFQAPSYVIEQIPDPGGRDASQTVPQFIYRITAMGFGPRRDIQAVSQVLYRQ